MKDQRVYVLHAKTRSRRFCVTRPTAEEGSSQTARHGSKQPKPRVSRDVSGPGLCRGLALLFHVGKYGSPTSPRLPEELSPVYPNTFVEQILEQTEEN